MGTILASTVISKAQIILQDVAGVRWSAPELLGWLNSGQREILIYKPNAHIIARNVQLSPGTRQKLPDDAIQLIDIPRNMGTDGQTPGRVVRQMARATLDAANPNWHTDTASAVVANFIPNPLDPKAFYCYPPQPATGAGFVEMIFCGSPQDITDPTEPIGLDDIYETPLIDYIVYRGFSKDSEYADVSKATQCYTMFSNALTGKARVESLDNPQLRAPSRTVTAATS